MRDWKTPLAEGVIIIIYYLKNLIKFNILILILIFNEKQVNMGIQKSQISLIQVNGNLKIVEYWDRTRLEMSIIIYILLKKFIEIILI